MKKRKLAKREKDNIYPALVSFTESEANFTRAVRKMLGEGYGLSFVKTGDEIRVVFTDKKYVYYGVGKSINEALGSAILRFYLGKI